MVRRLVLAAALAVGCGGAHKQVVSGGERTTEGVGLTVYNDGQSIVKEWRSLTLAKGRNTVHFEDVASFIDATSVHFHSITDPRTTVLEQNYQFDLANADTLLAKSIGLELTIVSVAKSHGKKHVAGKPRRVHGTLLSFEAGQIVVKTAEDAQPITIIARDEDLQSIQLGPGSTMGADGLVTKPTLVWLLDAAKAGKQLTKVTYQTSGMSWNADYTLVLGPGTKMGADVVDLTGWVTIANDSGASYHDAELKLVAGDVHRAPPPAPPATRAPMGAASAPEDAKKDTGFKEKSFFEYHLYTLGRTTTLPNASIKQIELFHPAFAVPANKVLVYDGANDNHKVDIYLEVKNEKRGGLGIPLPAGRVRLFQQDTDDGSLELIGQAQIEHTPKDELIRLRLGDAFDVVGDRKQLDSRMDEHAKTYDETYEIRLRNHKREAIQVIVKERVAEWANWEITAHSLPFEKFDAHTITMKADVAANAETVLTYRVHYSW